MCIINHMSVLPPLRQVALDFLRRLVFAIKIVVSPKHYEYQQALTEYMEKSRDWEKVAKRTAEDKDYQLTDEDKKLAEELGNADKRLRAAEKASGRD